MKKLFALLLAFSCLFLTACNQNPADSTIGKGNPQNPIQPNETELKDTIIYNKTRDFIDLPSRIVYDDGGIVYYYSKADGKAYVYCFDPLCEHKGDCLARPYVKNWNFQCTFFMDNRFYTTTAYGQIISFSFDGTDMKIEYDAGYDPQTVHQFGWTPNPSSYGKYIYVPLRADEKGNPHILRFHIETGEMEDLTEKTGNYVLPIFFYNGELYGTSSDSITWIKSDLGLQSCEVIEEIPVFSYISGNCFFSYVYNDQWDIDGIEIYDMKTGESEILTNELMGIEHEPQIVFIDEDYIYFYQLESIYLGDIIVKDELKPYYKGNDGSLYRVNRDGSGLICIYEESEFQIIDFEATIAGDHFLIKGQNVRVRDHVKETWDSGVLVGTIGADGKIDRLDPVEVVE